MHPELRTLAREAMIAEGFTLDLPADALAELAAIEPGTHDRPGDGPPPRDLRSLPWSSVDNADSLDLDQVEVVEPSAGDGLRLRVGVADVNHLVPRGSALDRYAALNTTSVYTGVETFPMLPERLSTNLTSLNEGVDRLAMVVAMTVTPDGALEDVEISRALVHNRARLSYDIVGPWLEGGRRVPREVSALPWVAGQLRLQQEAALRLRGRRADRGALALDTIDVQTVAVGGRVVELRETPNNAARELVEDFMIAANTAMARVLEEARMPALRRVVGAPRGWERLRELAGGLGGSLPDEPDALALSRFLDDRRDADPVHYPDLSLAVVKLLGAGVYAVDAPGSPAGGHFGLAVDDYTHSTAPNRRYADLVVQRQVGALLAGSPPPYSLSDLEGVAANCNERASHARRVERQVRKAAAATIMADRIGQEFDAIVTGVKETGTFVRLLHPPVEGRVTEGGEALHVGDGIRVRLLRTDAAVGHLDFGTA
ncbi:MAG: RNB domain-containing ribonuclease [Gemmatimonadaceae bacterium]